MPRLKGGKKKATFAAFSLHAQCEWPLRMSRFFFWKWHTVNIRPVFHVLGWGIKCEGSWSPLAVSWGSWLCVYLQCRLWCMWNPPYTRAHTHTPLKVCLYIYVDIYNLVLWLKLLLIIIIIKKVLGLCQNAAKHHLQLNFQRLIMYNTESFQKDKTV